MKSMHKMWTLVVALSSAVGCAGDATEPGPSPDLSGGDIGLEIDLGEEPVADVGDDATIGADTSVADTLPVVDTSPGTDTGPVTPTCTPAYCSSRGTCTADGACVCPDEWGGQRCEIPVPSGQRYIPPGQFDMGSPTTEKYRESNEKQHQVTLTRGFLLHTTEVTKLEWDWILGLHVWRPVCVGCFAQTDVSYRSAVAFANARSAKGGLQRCYKFTECGRTAPGAFNDWKVGELVTCNVEFAGLDCDGYRLPTEAEWEYAARAGTRTATYAGDLTAGGCDDKTLLPIAWFCGNKRIGFWQAVGQKQPNAWGLYDMLGNIDEWVADGYDENYGIVVGSGPITDPLPLPLGGNPILRGGYHNSRAAYVRAAARTEARYDGIGLSTGFRLARTFNPACEGTGYVGKNCDIPVCRPGCPGDETCIATNECTCTPNCADKACGDDGCGGSCGTCNDGVACTVDSCNTSGQCVATPEPGSCNDNDPCTADACGPTGCMQAPACAGPQSRCVAAGNSYSCACPRPDDIGPNCLPPCATGYHLDGDLYEPNECVEQATRVVASRAGTTFAPLSLNIGPASNDIDHFRLASPATSNRVS